MSISFYRSTYTNVAITLTSNEQLGFLDSDYIEDFNGVDGQLTVWHVSTSTAYTMLITPIPAETPQVNNDVFRGFIPLASIPDGNFEIRGRCRDVVGNYTILSSFNSPTGNERIFPLEFTVTTGQGYFLPIGSLRLSGVIQKGLRVPVLLEMGRLKS